MSGAQKGGRDAARRKAQRRVDVDRISGSLEVPKGGIAPWIGCRAGTRPELPLDPPDRPKREGAR